MLHLAFIRLTLLRQTLRDSNLPPYPVIATEMVDGSITVSGTVVPEPDTVLLLGMGFLGITGYLRKRLNKKMEGLV